MAYNDTGEAVGRIAIVSDNHLKTHNDGARFFSPFECVNDQRVADILFTTAAAFLRAQGMRPMNKALLKLGARAYKTYMTYDYHLSSTGG